MFKYGQTNPGSIKNAGMTITELDINNKPVILLIPYGLQMNLPSYPLMAITGHFEGQSDNRISFVTDPVNRDNQAVNNLSLAAGEVSIGIPALNTRLHFLANGNIEFISNGNAPSSGIPDYLVKYNELLTAFNQLKSDFNSLVSVFNSHVHTVVGSNGGGPVVFVPVGTTAASTTSGSNSSASMTGAKLSTFEVPNV